uniref:Uncharacterized protein n=1 Tax=Romanomermis culicivorax TaxID=13658 RepID=A0A915JDB5_ROMCU
MGVHVSRYNGLTKEQYEKSQQIDDLLKQERRLNAAIIKLLLLGAAEGGKSTFLKQLRILHQDRFNDNELEFQKHIIHNNILNIAISIYNAMCDRSMKFENVDRQEDIRTLIEASKFIKYDSWYNEKVEKALLRLKYDAAFHSCCIKQNEYELPESSKYFFDNLERICTTKYVPSEQDVVRSRVATTGINEIRLVIRSISFRIVDVGGQRSERRKWIHCFSDVDSLIFISSLSEYNLTLAEDMKTV